MDLHRMFYPRSIAVVGASPNLGGGKVPYYHLIQAAGFKGPLYPVNPAYQEINGQDVYPSLADIPQAVDYAVVSVPATKALETLNQAVEKGIRFVHFFTSGFSEVGNRKLENAMVDVARQHGTRIIGPNCFGAFCWESGLTYSFRVKQTQPGITAFLGQSGSLSDLFLTVANARGIAVNKAVSYGNQIDLRVEDYLAYLSEDDSIQVIAIYLEDIKNGNTFFKVLQQTAARKQVIVLKGGTTHQGAKAAASHTGAMAVSSDIFRSVINQTGCIEVETFEQMMDMVMVATAPKQPLGPRIGFCSGGGGVSVIAADLAARQGLELPDLAPITKERISQKISAVNTSVDNPIDLGAFGYDSKIVLHTIQALDNDPNLDIIVAQFIIGIYPVEPEYEADAFLTQLTTLTKPLYPIISTYSEHNPLHQAAKTQLFSLFRQADLPTFNSMAEVAVALKHRLCHPSPKNPS